MNNLVSSVQALEFLQQYGLQFLTPNKREPLGKAFLEHFKIPVPELQGLEIFGYCPATDLYHATDHAYAIKIIFTKFVQELVE